VQDRQALTDPTRKDRVCGAIPSHSGGYGYWLTRGV
jgi:hypothetical protein